MNDRGAWTNKDGRANSSDLYIEIVEEVARRMRNLQVGSSAESEARALVSMLAYEYGLAPVEETQ